MTSFSPEVHTDLLQLAPFPWQERLWTRLLEQKQNGQLAHAYLIQGNRGIGKRLFVEKMAVNLLCLETQSAIACNKCSICKMATSGSLPDLLVVEPEQGGRNIKIDQIRQLSDFVTKSSHGGSGKVVILDNAHSLNNSAANALLKTLEEPSESTYLFLITELPGALSATIRSRCQRLQFSAPTPEQSSSWLKEHAPKAVEIESNISNYITQPLLAFTENHSSTKEDRSFITDLLSKIISNPGELRHAVVSSSKVGELATIGYLLEVSTILIKDLLTDTAFVEPTSNLSKLGNELCNSGLNRRELGLRLLGYQQQLSIAQRQLMSSANPNPQLIIESVLWRWSKLLA